MDRSDNAPLGGLADLPEHVQADLADFLRRSARPAPNSAALAEELSESLALKEALSPRPRL